MAFIRQVFGWKPGRDTNSPEVLFSFTQFTRENEGTLAYKLRLLPSIRIIPISMSLNYAKASRSNY